MGNRSSAEEWLTKAWHDLSSARILYAAHHYTDAIGIDLQQAIEKSLKSFLAYGNKPIKKSHDLVEISKMVDGYIQFSALENDFLDRATTYYTQDKYPSSNMPLPPREQIKEILDFAKLFLNRHADNWILTRRKLPNDRCPEVIESVVN
jgi:HEPN domain-containing protein